MRIEYENKFRDVLLFNMAHQLTTPLLQGTFLILSMAIAWNPQSWIYTMVWTVITYSSIWIIQFVFTALLLYSRHNHTMLTKHVVELQENGLLEETTFNRSMFFWTGGIHKVVVRANRVAIYITPFMAHIIPPDAFSSKAHRQDFIETVRSKMKPAS